MFLGLYNRLYHYNKEIEFKLSEIQKEHFNNHFDMIHSCLVDNENFTASIRRMGVITYRIAMILNILRFENTEILPSVIECTEEDFQVALIISESLLEHAMLHYQRLPEGTNGVNYSEKKNNNRKRCYCR